MSSQTIEQRVAQLESHVEEIGHVLHELIQDCAKGAYHWLRYRPARRYARALNVYRTSRDICENGRGSESGLRISFRELRNPTYRAGLTTRLSSPVTPRWPKGQTA